MRGRCKPDKLIDGIGVIRAGDLLIGLESSGLHSNGFSLVRKIFGNYNLDEVIPELGTPLGEVLLTPTRIYVKQVLEVMEKLPVPGMVHITGGGLTENIPRVLPQGLGVEIMTSSWKIPSVFNLLQETGTSSKRKCFGHLIWE